MMASTKKPKISKKAIEIEKELKTIDELYREHDRLLKKEQDEIIQVKNNYIETLYDNTEEILSEIETLKNIRDHNKKELVYYILKKIKGKYGNEEQLSELDIYDLYKIVDEINNGWKYKLKKFFNFFNI